LAKPSPEEPDEGFSQTLNLLLDPFLAPPRSALTET